MPRIFISHASNDVDASTRLLEWLRSQGFNGNFLDFDKYAGIPPGADWEHTLYREIARAEAVILVLTTRWFASKWCFAEFIHARALGKPIIPLIEGPASDTLVSPDIQHLDLRTDRERGLEMLSSELTRIALNARGEFPWDATRPPFPGLLAYEESDAAIYFGRDDDIRQLIERLNSRRALGGTKFLALLGASGSGKSSLVRAGIVPRLKRDRRGWIVIPPFRPQVHPLDELAQALAQMLPGKDWRFVQAILSSENLEESLQELSRDLRAAHGANDAHILVSIDQGEELFGAANVIEARDFWKLLNTMVGEHLPFIELMGLRADYLGQLQQVPDINARFDEFRLTSLPLERIRDVIEGPARVARLRVDGALVAAAMQDAATEDALPLLAFALRELHDRFAENNGLTVDAYRALGDPAAGLSPLENAVRQRAERVLTEANPKAAQLKALKEAFIPSMVRINAEGEYARRPARLDTLPILALPLLELLTRARLLVMRRDDNVVIVEVAHEALFRTWPMLNGWLSQEREFLTWRADLERAHMRWATLRGRQRRSALLVARVLGQSQLWQRRKKQIAPEIQRFVELSKSPGRLLAFFTLSLSFPFILIWSFSFLDNVMEITASTSSGGSYGSYEFRPYERSMPILIGYCAAFIAYIAVICAMIVKAIKPRIVRFAALKLGLLVVVSVAICLPLLKLFFTITPMDLLVVPW